VPKLSDTQKTGKEPVYSFAQLAALFKSKDEVPPPPAEQPVVEKAPAPAEAPKPDAPPAE
jgi:hypothetical protein